MGSEGRPHYDSWELPEELWAALEPLVSAPVSQRGRPRTVDLRHIAEGIFYVLRTGIQWRAVPRERFGAPSTVWWYFNRWATTGVFAQVWAAALAVYR